MPSKVGYGYKIKTWLEKFFDLKEDMPPMLPPHLAESIVGVIDLGWYLGHWMHNSTTTSITGVGWHQVWVSESTHRTLITHAHLKRDTGNFTFTVLLAHDSSRTLECRIANWSAAAEKYLPQDSRCLPIWLEPNDKLYIYCDAHTTTGNFTINLWTKVWKTNKERDPWREL